MNSDMVNGCGGVDVEEIIDISSRNIKRLNLVGVELSERLFDFSGLRHYLSGDSCCMLHSSVDSVVGESAHYLIDDFGYHPAIRAIGIGFRACKADSRTLKIDKQFAKDMLSMAHAGFAYLKEDGLPTCRRFETGAVFGVEAFGKGYCHIGLIRPAARMRVARVLGPCPLASDLWLALRLVGARFVNASIECVGPDLLHVDMGGARVSVASIAHVLLKQMRINPRVRVGVSWCAEVVDSFVSRIVGSGDKVEEKSVEEVDERVGYAVAGLGVDLQHPSDDEHDSLATRVFAAVGRKGKAACSRCGKVVNPDTHVDCVKVPRMHCEDCGFWVVAKDHGMRCVQQSVRSARLELLGDALHALDVKLVVSLSGVGDGALTQVAERYIRASSQRRYLEDNITIKLPRTSNTHSWGSAFERMYRGKFRQDYLEWLSKDIGFHGERQSYVIDFVNDYKVEDVVKLRDK